MQEQRHGTAKFLGHRLRQWRKQIPLKSFELAKLIKISQGSLSDIENNKSLPSADTIAKLYQYTNLNVIWLLTGNGPVLRSEKEPSSGDDQQLVQESVEVYGEDQKLRELIEKLIRIYRRGDSEKKAHLIGFLNGADPGDPE